MEIACRQVDRIERPHEDRPDLRGAFEDRGSDLDQIHRLEDFIEPLTQAPLRRPRHRAPAFDDSQSRHDKTVTFCQVGFELRRFRLPNDELDESRESIYATLLTPDVLRDLRPEPR